MLCLLEQLKNEHLLSELSYQFAKLIDRQQQAFAYAEPQRNLAVLLSALLTTAVSEGNSCLDLTQLPAENPFRLPAKYQALSAQLVEKIGQLPPTQWQSQLVGHIAVSDSPDNIAPILLQQNKAYLYRYWQSEHQIATILYKMAAQPPSSDDDLNASILTSFFPEPEHHINWQKIAVATALKQPFSVISGGPGTGKTRTVAILLAALQLKQLTQDLPPLKIALVAPTGKAAARLKESISASLTTLNLPENLPKNLKNTIPIQALTIHRLLGIRPDSDKPTYHAQNPLHIDLLVVDEASMIDLFLMEKLLNAIKPHTRLILLGDKDQLASVEAGNIMAELGNFLHYGYSQGHSEYLARTTGHQIPSIQNVPPICDSLCHLRHSYRFDEHSGIGRLAAEINAQQGQSAWQQFSQPQYQDLTLILYPPIQAFKTKTDWTKQCVQLVVEKAVELYRHYLNLVQQRQQSPTSVAIADIFSAFQQIRFLSALRVGELGVEQLNQSIAEALHRARLVSFRHSRENYLGKPILITENVPQLQVFSGDIGLVLNDEAGKLRIYFDTEIDGNPHHISATRLPNHEPAYVLTVHKSQGSEFAHTLLIMPLHNSPVLSKELLYTAVTRAKQHFTLFSDEKIWKQAVSQQNQRQSGLMEQLLALNR